MRNGCDIEDICVLADDHPKSIVWIHGEETSAPGLPGFLKSARKEPQGSRLRYVYSRGSSGAAASLIEHCRRLDLVSNMIVNGRNGCYLAASEPEHTKVSQADSLTLLLVSCL